MSNNKTDHVFAHLGQFHLVPLRIRNEILINMSVAFFSFSGEHLQVRTNEVTQTKHTLLVGVCVCAFHAPVAHWVGGTKPAAHGNPAARAEEEAMTSDSCPSGSLNESQPHNPLLSLPSSSFLSDRAESSVRLFCQIPLASESDPKPALIPYEVLTSLKTHRTPWEFCHVILCSRVCMCAHFQKCKKKNVF